MGGLVRSVKSQFRPKQILKLAKHGFVANTNPIRGTQLLADDAEADYDELMGKEKVETPVLIPEKVMPTIDDDAIQAAKRRKAAAIQAQSGRNSTVLSDRLGG